jgi:N-acetylglucosaminyldiphosphoundecaprenol N-acetyl-beta-D-mannosaminyltransferase
MTDGVRLNTIHCLGVPLHPMSMAGAANAVLGWSQASAPQGYVCLAAAHSLMACREDARTRNAFAGSLANFTDGMSLVWFSRWSGVPEAERIYAGDLIPAIAAGSVQLGLRHYFYGGAPGVAARLAEVVQARFPGFKVVGTWSPPFGPVGEEEDRAEIERIDTARPDIIWVGLGAGKQEPWMAEHRSSLGAALMIGIGAAFDYISGNTPQAPRWMQGMGLEWLFRLASEPRRLWPRYREYPLFVLLATAQLLGLKRFPTHMR